VSANNYIGGIYMLIQNVNGTSKRLPDGYSSWIKFWEAKTGETAGVGKVGGHVTKTNSNDNAWYIAAITSAENNATSPYNHSGTLAKLHD